MNLVFSFVAGCVMGIASGELMRAGQVLLGLSVLFSAGYLFLRRNP